MCVVYVEGPFVGGGRKDGKESMHKQYQCNYKGTPMADEMLSE